MGSRKSPDGEIAMHCCYTISDCHRFVDTGLIAFGQIRTALLINSRSLRAEPSEVTSSCLHLGRMTVKMVEVLLQIRIRTTPRFLAGL